MPIYTLEESTYAGPIPEDEVLAAEVTGIKEVTKPFKDNNGNDVIRVEFAFAITEPDSPWESQRLWGDTSTVFTTNPDCRLRAWAQELIGDELAANFVLDTDTLVGLPCRVVVAQKTYQKDGQDKTRNFVKDVLRPRGAMAHALSAPAYVEEPF